MKKEVLLIIITNTKTHSTIHIDGLNIKKPLDMSEDQWYKFWVKLTQAISTAYNNGYAYGHKCGYAEGRKHKEIIMALYDDNF